MAKKISIHKDKKNFSALMGYFIMYLMVGFIPHIYRYVPFAPAESESIYFKESIYVDLYMLAKSRVFLVLTVLLLGVFMYQLVKKDMIFIKDKIAIGTGLFAIVVILSSVVSEYQDLVYWGAKDRFEGMWVWLAYLVVFTVARHYGADKKFVERLLKIFVFSASIMAVFGIMQVFGYDIYTEGPLRWLCFPREIAQNIDRAIVQNTTDLMAVGSMFNANYFGVYSAVATIASILFCFRESNKIRILFFLLVLVNYAGVIASRSEAALIGLVVSMVVFVIRRGDYLIKSKRYTVSLFACLLVVQLVISNSVYRGQSKEAIYIYLLMIIGSVLAGFINYILNRIDLSYEVLSKKSKLLAIIVFTVSVLLVNLIMSIVPNKTYEHRIENLQINRNQMSLNVGNTDIDFRFTDFGVEVYYQDQMIQKISNKEENEYRFEVADEKFKLEFKLYSNGYIVEFMNPLRVHFFYDGNGIEYVSAITGVDSLEYPERVNYYYLNGDIFSGRGYIWSTFIPLLKLKPIYGHGFDTYLMLYPQNDFVGKHNFLLARSVDTLIDKPHSTYVSVLLSTGLIGALLMISFILLIIDLTIRKLNNRVINNEFSMLIIIIIVAAVFNDSIIPITMLMFIFSGLFTIE